MGKPSIAKGIDQQFRPQGYFWALDNHIRLASDITGAERRAAYETALREGRHDAAEAILAEPVLGPSERQMIGSIHPAFMGGEYLPRRQTQEVEIARITIASTTQDVTCVYARRGRSRIHYRTVDEYEGMTLHNSRRTSIQPLTLGQLTDFFLSSWDLMNVLEVNFADHGYPRRRVHDFIVDASSSFYAQFGDLISERVDQWLDDKAASVEIEETEHLKHRGLAARIPRGRLP